MKNKLLIIFVMVFLFLPIALAQVEVQLGEDYVNIVDISEIRFNAHSDYYELCGGDRVTIPVLIKNNNTFADILQFGVDKEYASFPVKSAELPSGKSAIFLLNVNPPIDLEENTTIILDIITKKEKLKRSVIIKANLKKCYLFDLRLSKDEDEICGCDAYVYDLVLKNNGDYTDSIELTLDLPGWVNSTLTNETITLLDGGEKKIRLDVSPPCEEKGTFEVKAKAVSEKTKTIREATLKLDVLPQKECYNTIISASDVKIDYLGKNIPVEIKNKGAKDAAYSLNIEGINWYELSQAAFSLKQNEKKTINLALYPEESVAEGDYNIDITARADGQEFKKSIKVKLRKSGAIFEKIKFYLNYFKYYIGAGIVLLVILLLILTLVKKKRKKKSKEKREKIERKKEEKIEEKKITEKKIKKKEVKKIKIAWLMPLIIYIISLGLLSLLVYSTFRYRTYYEKVLNFISNIFEKYLVPFLPYLKYAVIGVGIVFVMLLVIDFLRKKTKKRVIKKEKPKAKKIEIKKGAKKVIPKKVGEKRKLRLFEYVYIILVMVLFLGIIGYIVYRFLGKSIAAEKFVFVSQFIKNYSVYISVGVGVLLVLFILAFFLKKNLGKRRKTKGKKVSKNVIKSFAIIFAGLVILSGVIYLFVYYNLFSYIKDFFLIYYPYILIGIGLLLFLILILSFQKKSS